MADTIKCPCGVPPNIMWKTFPKGCTCYKCCADIGAPQGAASDAGMHVGGNGRRVTRPRRSVPTRSRSYTIGY